MSGTVKLRWLQRTVRYASGTTSLERVLQYTTFENDVPGLGLAVINAGRWTPWQDVPEVKEIDVQAEMGTAP